MTVAAFLNYAGGSPESRIQAINKILDQSTSANADNLNRFDYISGLDTGNRDGESYYTIATNFSTSSYMMVFLHGGSDQITVQEGGANLGNDKGFKKEMSRKDLIKKYGSYKNQLDSILTKMEKSKDHMADINEQLQSQASNYNDSDEDDDD